jgi:hypothetical protein
MLKLLVWAFAHLLIPFLYHWIRPYGYSLAAYGSAAVAAAIGGLVVVRWSIHGQIGPTAEVVLWGLVPALAILANHLAFVIWGGLRTLPSADAPVPPPEPVAAPVDDDAPAEDPAWITIRVYASSAEQYGYLRDRDRLDEAGIPYRVVPAGAAALQVAPADAERACNALGIAPDDSAPAG